jgi:hypothetical protein
MSSLFSETPHDDLLLGHFRKQAAHHLMALWVSWVRKSAGVFMLGKALSHRVYWNRLALGSSPYSSKACSIRLYPTRGPFILEHCHMMILCFASPAPSKSQIW